MTENQPTEYAIHSERKERIYMISIDTDMLRQLAAAAKEANEAIENATLRLTAITEHRDWGCKEKNTINEYTVNNKKKIRILQDNSSSFLSALNDVVNDFENTEKNVCNNTGGIDSVIANIMDIAKGSIIGQTYETDNNMFHSHSHPTVISEAAVSVIDSVIKDIPQFKPAVDMPGVAICNFNDIDLSAGGEK